MSQSVFPRRRIALFVDLDNAQIAAGGQQFVHCAHSLVWPGPLVHLVERSLGGRVDIRCAYGDAMGNARRVFQDHVWKAAVVRERIDLDRSIQESWAMHGF